MAFNFNTGQRFGAPPFDLAAENAPPSSDSTLRQQADWMVRQKYRVEPDPPGTTQWNLPDGKRVTDPFNLNAGVGWDMPNKPEDVQKVQAMLGRTRHYDYKNLGGANGRFNTDLGEAIEHYQGTYQLEMDGQINPGGPTIQAAAQRFGHPPPEVANLSDASEPGISVQQTPTPDLPPAFRNQVPGVGGSWDKYRQALSGIPGMSPNRLKAGKDFFAAEGGNATDAQSKAVAGMTQDGLNEAAKFYPELSGKTPKDLLGNFPLMARAHDGYFQSANKPWGGNEQVDRLPSAETVSAITNVQGRLGGEGGRKMVKTEMNELIGDIPEFERQQHGLMRVTENNPQQTMDMLQRLERAGFGEHLRDRIGMKLDTNEKTKNEKERNDYFRFRRPLP